MNKSIDLNNLDKSSWQSFTFEQIAEKISKTVQPSEAGVDVYVGLEHIDANDIHIRRKGIPSAVKGGKLRCSPGDVIFGKRRAYQRKVAIVDFEGICSAHAFVFRAIREVIEPKLFPFFLHSDQFMHRMIDISVGGLSPTINWGDLKHQEFLLPPKEQQAEIAELLWAMDEVIQRNIKSSANLYSLYITKIERELLRKTAKKRVLGELGSIVRGVGYKPQDLLDEYGTDCCILLRSNNISRSKVNFKDINILPNNKVKKEQFLIKDDFAICMSNGSKELVGKAAKFTPDSKNVAVGSFCAVMRPNSMISTDLLEHLFASKSYRFAIKRALSGSAINNLKPSDIEGLSLRLNENMQEVKQTLISLGGLLEASKYTDQGVYASKSLQKSLINQVF
jgi:type I restriction enzyme S subunit